MGRLNTPKLSSSEKLSLEKAFEQSPNASFRKRCQMILLKSQGRTSKDVGQITGVTHVTVNSWLTHYKSEGIEGLKIKPGRGRKTIIHQELDEPEISALVKKHRQRVSMAKAEWEASSGKSVSERTFKRFLKSLADDISASESDVKGSRTL